MNDCINTNNSRTRILLVEDIKACYITAYDIPYEELRRQFPDSHIDCFIKKPIQINDLVKRANAELGLL
jgi:response regulator RpfG family c-di-GMP phosphodiesterase